MTDIEVVVKIPEEKYQTILNHTEEILDESSFIEPKYLYRALLDGTPLPKGHGRLFDERDIVNGDYEVIGNRIYELEPIIEADRNEK